MSPTIAKIVAISFSGATVNDPVTIENTTTGDLVTKHPDGTLFRVKGTAKTMLYDCNNFPSGWDVGDVIAFSIGGTKAGTEFVTLTKDEDAPQKATNTVVTSSTAVLSI